MPLPAGDAARLGRHRRADPGLDARHQLRVHLGGLPRGAGQIPVHAARPRGRVRHAGLLRPVADADADHHRPAAQGRAARRQPDGARRTGSARFHAGFERGFERMRDGYVGLLDGAARTPRSSCRSSPCWCLRSAARMFTLVGRDFFPADRRRPDPAACPRAGRHPDRGDRADLPGGRGQDPRDHPRAAIATLIVDNIGLPARAYNLAFTDGSTIGVNDGVILVSLKEGHAPTADYVRKLREVLPAAFPGGDVLFPGRRHRHPDPQLRPAGADRRAHRRL